MPKANAWFRSRPVTVIWLLLPLAVYLVPPEWVYGGRSLCLFRNIFGVECWGCGMTRAIYSAMHLDFRLAWEYNPLVVVAFPLLVWLWGKESWSRIRGWRMRG